MDFEDITEETISNTPDDVELWYILEVDLKYPLHDFHNCYPFTSEKVQLKKEDLSPYLKGLLDSGRFIQCKKLIPSLNDKQNYILHYRNLKLYLLYRLKLESP